MADKKKQKKATRPAPNLKTIIIRVEGVTPYMQWRPNYRD